MGRAIMMMWRGARAAAARDEDVVHDEDDLSGPGPEAPEAVAGMGVVGRATAGAGALSALALVGAFGWWCWDLAVRDLSGVPVVRALEGPARVAPDEPGGAVASHQGLAINAVQADADEHRPDRVVLAPRAAGIAPDDAARPTPTAARAPVAEPAPAGATVTTYTVPVEVPAEPAPEATPEAAEPEVDPIQAALAEALGEPAPDARASEAPVALALLSDAGVVLRSPRPARRP